MPTLEWTRHDTGSVTLVGFVVATETAARVRIDPAVDGPVWPPRRQGRPAAGWDGACYEGTVPAEGRLVVGFATPADPADPPADVTELGPPTGDETDAPTEAALVRQLGEAGPPSAAVPGPDERAGDRQSDAVAAANQSKEDTDGSAAPPTESTADTGADDGTRRSSTHATDAPSEPPAAVREWLDAVEARLAAAEELAEVGSVSDARTAVQRHGGIDGVRDLEAALAADRRALEALGRRRGDLAERLAAADVPTDTLSRLV